MKQRSQHHAVAHNQNAIFGTVLQPCFEAFSVRLTVFGSRRGGERREIEAPEAVMLDKARVALHTLQRALGLGGICGSGPTVYDI